MRIVNILIVVLTVLISIFFVLAGVMGPVGLILIGFIPILGLIIALDIILIMVRIRYFLTKNAPGFLKPTSLKIILTAIIICFMLILLPNPITILFWFKYADERGQISVPLIMLITLASTYFSVCLASWVGEKVASRFESK